ncbi:Hsp20/alpha crystallin family protein [Pedobacter sp. P26]
MLSISTGQHTENNNEGKTYNRREYSYASFTRAFTLPESADVDRIEAAYTDGILKLNIPKKEEAKAVSRQIEIQ